MEQTLAAYKLWHTLYNSFPRLSKFSLGIKIDTLFTEALEQLFQARYASRDQKRPYILQASKRLDLLKFFMQAAWELKCISPKQFATISAPLAEIGSMIGGWLKDPQKEQASPQRQGL